MRDKHDTRREFGIGLTGIKYGDFRMLALTDPVLVLNYGVIGLGFLLALLDYRLLRQEQTKEEPRKSILVAIHTFMLFSICLCIVGLFSEYYRGNRAASPRETAENDKLKGDIRHVTGRITNATLGKDWGIIHCQGDVSSLDPASQRLWMAVEVGGHTWFKEGQFFYSLDHADWIVTIEEKGSSPVIDLVLYATTMQGDTEIRDWLKKGSTPMGKGYKEVDSIQGIYKLHERKGFQVPIKQP